ncbi:MAG: putative Integral rane protein [Parcubacteria group bacterium]|nr:putative Integral rane protein [Parcubacteria group bacterium]
MVSKRAIRVYSSDMKRLIFSFRTAYQFGFALLIVAALTTQFIYGGFIDGFTLSYIGLFISYFTILSNILVAIVLYVEAEASLKRKSISARFEWVRGFTVFCILTTGIVYTFFLRGPGGTMLKIDNSLSWANLVFHHVMPIVIAADWLLFPPKRTVRWVSILYWIGLTTLYAFYVLALGLWSGAYPYFFLDPTRPEGYSGVLHGCIAFIPFLLVIGGVIVLANKIRIGLSSSRRK